MSRFGDAQVPRRVLVRLCRVGRLTVLAGCWKMIFRSSDLGGPAASGAGLRHMVQSAGPNRALRALLAETAWTEDHLARQVNTLATEAGMVLRLDRRSVTHWLAGRRPRPPVPALIAEAFTRELGRPVTIALAGLGTRAPAARARHSDCPVAGPGHLGGGLAQIDGGGNVVRLLQQLGFDDSRRQILAAGVYSVAALEVPGWAQAVARPGAAASSGARLDPVKVSAAELMTRVFSDADRAFGGGHSLDALSAYLAGEIAPLVRASGPGRLRSRVRSAAAELAYLAGFMCFDNEQHARAQAYYRVALDLAAESGDSARYAVTLRAMSVQARVLGHPRHAFHLAETAATTAGRRVPPIRRAFLLGQVAVAAAADGDRGAALSALRAAEHHFDRAASRAAGDPTGGFHLASLAHQEAAVHALLGNQRAAVKALTVSLRHRPATERRSRAITTARLAELHLATGHLDQATTTWHAFLDDYPHLHSARAAKALTHMRERLRPHARHPAARQLLAHAAALHTLPHHQPSTGSLLRRRH
jgi:hypothetical protein